MIFEIALKNGVGMVFLGNHISVTQKNVFVSICVTSLVGERQLKLGCCFCPPSSGQEIRACLS